MNNKHKIIIFSLCFFALQVMDLWLTSIALKNPGVYELNPYYNYSWHAPVKLGAIIVIAPILYKALQLMPRFTTGAMYFMLGGYIFVCLNNLYWVIK